MMDIYKTEENQFNSLCCQQEHSSELQHGTIKKSFIERWLRIISNKLMLSELVNYK